MIYKLYSLITVGDFDYFDFKVLLLIGLNIKIF